MHRLIRYSLSLPLALLHPLVYGILAYPPAQSLAIKYAKRRITFGGATGIRM
jgi:hypothetical protein